MKFTGFSKLDREARLQWLADAHFLTPDDLVHLTQSADKAMIELADHLIENVIGCFMLPLGVATHFHIDEKDYLIPMAVEETSIVAAASRTAKWCRQVGTIKTAMRGSDIIGQIQLAKVRDSQRCCAMIATQKSSLIQQANTMVVSSLVRRGGGVTDLSTRILPRGDGSDMVVIHVHLNACDAMGANLITQVCEFLKAPIEACTGERVAISIISNLVDTKIAMAEVVLTTIEPTLADAIAEASLFATCDPYRAATHNKGILNGIDAVAIATGNDWRAIEAGIHAYAAREGHYQPVTRWVYRDRQLIGTFEAPIAVGTVGGVTRLHPTAKLALRLLNVQSADELSRVIAAVGLVQNLGALRALVSEGLVAGHMRLHVNNLLLEAGATADEFSEAKRRLEALLETSSKVTVSDAKQVIEGIRRNQSDILA